MRTTDCPPTISLPTAILVLFRNPQDTAASFFHFLKNISDIPSYNSWDEFFSEFMSGKGKHIEDENVMIITYEDLKELNSLDSLKAEQIQSTADRGNFQVTRKKSQEIYGSVGPILFRKGAVGDWKNLFTEAQSQEMDAKFKECLGGTKLKANLKYDVYCKA
ncbi:unnamed protein product [Eretmochelys imbricata]